MNNDFFEYKFESTIDKTKLPSNIATIDEGEKVGNTYTKEKVDELLSGSTGGNGKNIANADLQIPAGTVRTLNVTGAKFQIRGLKDKDADSSFNKRVVVNENGEFALKDSADIKVIIPENTTVNINHQYPNAVPSNIPEGVERIREFIKNLKTAQFNKLTEDDFSINIDETLKNNFRKKGNGIQYLEKSTLPNNSPYVRASQIMGACNCSVIVSSVASSSSGIRATIVFITLSDNPYLRKCFFAILNLFIVIILSSTNVINVSISYKFERKFLFFIYLQCSGFIAR